MNQEARQLSLNIESVSRAIAEWTVSRHSEIDETLAERYGARWRHAWVGEVEQILAHLAQAIAVGRSEIVRHAVVWSGQAFSARHANRADLGCMLTCLREVMQEKMSDAAWQPAVAYLVEAAAALDSAEPPSQSPFDATTTDGVLVLRYLEAILQGDRAGAERLVLDTAGEGMPVPDIYDRLLRPAMVEIGRMWHQDEIAVADEHFATVVTAGAMARLRGHFDARRSNSRRIVTTSVAGELHGLGVQMVADLFEIDGWHVISLGVNTPAPDVVECVRVHGADVLAVSTTSFLHLRATFDLIDAVRARNDLGEPRILVGGAPFRLIGDLWQTMSADACADTAAAAVEAANRLAGA